MVDFTKMDNTALAAAALTPSADSANTGVQADNTASNTLIPNSQDPAQTATGNKRTTSTSKQAQRKKRTVSFRERSASAPASSSSNQYRTARKTYRNYRDHDNSDGGDGDGDGEQYQHLLPPVANKSQRRKPEKSLSQRSISQKELSDLGLGITHSHSSGRHERKARTTAYGSYDQMDHERDYEDDEYAPDEPARRPRAAATVTAAVETPGKKGPIRLILNSDPFTPSPPGSVTTSSDPETESGDDNNEDDDEDEYAAPKPSRRKRRQQRRQQKEQSSAKKTSSLINTDPKSKGSSKGKGKPTSATRSNAAKNRKYNFPVAHTLSEASAADRMMFRWRGQGKSWSEITTEWTRLTGRQPGRSSLSVRFGKLMQRFLKPADMDIARLHTIKNQVEHEFEVAKWDRIAALIIADGGGTYTPAQLKIMWADLVEEGEQSPPYATTPTAGAATAGAAGPAGAAETQEEEVEEKSEWDAKMDRMLMGISEDESPSERWYQDTDDEAEDTPSKKKMKMTVADPEVEVEEEEVEAALHVPAVAHHHDNDVEEAEHVEHGEHGGEHAGEGEQVGQAD